MRLSSRFAALVACAACLALVVVACGSEPEVERALTTVPQARDDAPNVVVIMTDDQTVEQMRVMDRTNELLGDQGTTFSNFVTSFPLCCPSRTTFLTGQYAFNHGVTDNIGPNGGYYSLDNRNTLAVWLQRAGYATDFVGHYLYRYGVRERTEVPPGWDRWFSTIDPTTFHYYGYTVNDGGVLREFGNDSEDYQTDVMADRAVAEIEQLAEGDKPFFLNFWTLAPHVAEPENSDDPDLQAVPAPRHRGVYEQEWWTAEQVPAFNEEDVSDKPLFVQLNGRFLPVTEVIAQAHYQRALESLLAVDEAVGRIVDALERTGELDDTVIMFTSDNGYLQGEHRFRDAKTLPYEEAIRVPLLVRGPGFPAGATAPQLTSNIDLAPTILELAGVSGSLVMDGQSLLGLASDATPPDDDRAIYLQNGAERGDQGATIPHWEGVRVPGYTYVEYDRGGRELYDLTADPAQLDNRAGDPAYAALQRRLADLLEELRGCEGDACREPRFAASQ